MKTYFIVFLLLSTIVLMSACDTDSVNVDKKGQEGTNEKQEKEKEEEKDTDGGQEKEKEEEKDTDGGQENTEQKVTSFKYPVSILEAGKTYTLQNDITVEKFETIPSLKGILDGNGKTITINSFAPGANGLINVIESRAQVKNLKIRLAANITLSGAYTGVLAGQNEGSITKVQILGNDKTVTTSHSGKHMSGGLIGQNKGNIQTSFSKGNIQTSFSEVSIISESTSNSPYAGGLIGQNTGTVKNSYSTGSEIKTLSVLTLAYAGGFIGQNTGTVEYSYSTATTIEANPKIGSGSGYIGRFIGQQTGGTLVRNLVKTILNPNQNVYNNQGGNNVKDTNEAAATREAILLSWPDNIWNLETGKWPTLK